MAESRTVRRNVALQRQWYGEPLRDRVRRIVVAYDVSQAELAGVLGISAAMLSQVMNGHRAKIGNPTVLIRLVMLERKVSILEAAPGCTTARRRALEEVRNSRPTLGPETLPIYDDRAERMAATALRAVAEPQELEGAADLIAGGHPTLAGLLRRVARMSEAGIRHPVTEELVNANRTGPLR